MAHTKKKNHIPAYSYQRKTVFQNLLAKISNRTGKYVTLLVISSFLVSIGYLKPGLPKTDDGVLMVIRASGFHESFVDGHVPVRWIQRLNENYGYPVTNFLYPLPFYVAEAFQVVGLSALQSVKAVMILSTVASGIGMFLFLRHKTTPFVAFLASLVYLVTPYILFDLYSRGSLGEIVSFGIVPFVFYFLEKYLRTKKQLCFFLTAISWALLIISHNSLALLFSLLISGYYFAQRSIISKKALATYTLLVALVSCMSAWFWLPALYDLQFTRSSTVQISNIGDQFQPLLELSQSLGYVTILVLLTAFVLAIKTKKGWYWICVIFIALLLQLKLTQPIWQTFHLDRIIQFPFRLLSIVTFAIPVLFAYMLDYGHRVSKKTVHLLATLTVVGLLLLSTLQGLSVENQRFPETYFLSNFDSTTNQKEFTPKSVSVDPDTYATKAFEINALPTDFQIIETDISTQEKYLQLLLDEDVEVIFNTHYFPGWKVMVDDEVQNHTIDEQGRIHVQVSNLDTKNKIRTVKLVWQETPLRTAANLVSLISVFGCLALVIYLSVNKNKSLTAGILSAIVILFSLGSSILFKTEELKASFDPAEWEQRFLDSQWVNPKSIRPIGDHGLYMWAGWAYVHGENPILINPEMPPLGKYLIGSGLVLTNRPAIVGLFFSLTLLASLFLLSKEVLRKDSLALIPVALFSLERIYRNSIVYTMLDNIQLTVLLLAFLFILKAERNWKWLILASLCIGGVISTKFYATGILVSASVIAYYVVTKRFSLLAKFLLVMPLIGLVHMVSYWRFFMLGNSIREYLGTQKWIFKFYQAGSPSVPLGSYWRLVFFNQWRVWWGPAWGEFYILKAKEWNPLWPLNGLVTIGLLLSFLKKTFGLWVSNKKIIIPSYFLLLSWLGIYSMFLTMIGGWPHYMLLFLPFSNILMIKLIAEHRHKLASMFKIIK